MSNSPLLEVRGLQAGYGNKLILRGVTLDLRPGERVALFGHNGAGKSTLLRALFGLLVTQAGEVYLAGERLTDQRPDARARAGMAFVPQARPIFAELTVEENLRLGLYALRASRRAEAATLEPTYAVFPDLAGARRQVAGSLSGGQQRLLAIAMALARRPRLLLLDEPSIGLSPAMVHSVFEALAQVSAQLGATILLAEQNVKQALRLAERAYVLKIGQVAWSGASTNLGERGAVALANLM
jgi:branched-chain amino acid transport system ATP-binding protein